MTGPSSNPTPTPVANGWVAELLQLVLFPIDSPLLADRQWWKEVTSEEPEKTERKTTERAAGGAYRGQWLGLTVEANRIVWLASRLPSEELPDIGGLGDFKDARDTFFGSLNDWLREKCPPLRRVGFAGKVFLPTDSRDDNYRMLGRLLPAVRVDLDSSEFQYRINRRKASESNIPGLMINRLSTWSSARLVGVTYELTGEKNAPSHKVLDKHACMLDFDINNPIEEGFVIPRERLMALVTEFGQFAEALASYGDVR